MLDYMRQNSRSAIIYVLFGVIIAAFVISFGPQSKGCGRSGVAVVATVNGVEVDSTDLRMEYIRRFGTVGSRRLDDGAWVKERTDVTETLVQLALLAQEAQRLGLTVSEAELADYLKDPARNPDYRMLEVEGSFDPVTYRRLVTGYFQTSLERYERIRRWEVLARKLIEYYRSQVPVSEQAVTELYGLRETKVNVEFVAVRPSDQTEVVDPTEEELTAWSASHTAEVAEYYEKHKVDYDRPKQARVRQIFLKSPAADPAPKRETVRKRAAELRQQVLDGGDLEALARQHSEHPGYKMKGGDMGWQSEGNNDKAFDTAVFSLARGAVAEVVETPRGYFVLRVEDLRPASKRTVAEATPEIAKTLWLEEQRSLAARKQAEAILTLVQSGKTLAEAALAVAPAPAPASPVPPPAEGAEAPKPASRYAVQETGLFNQEGKAGAPQPGSPFSFGRPWDQVPRIGRSADVSRAAFALKKDAPVAKEAYELNGTWYVLRLKERADPEATVPADSKARLLSELARAKEQKLLGDWERVLFYPRTRYLFGAPPTFGPWMQRVVDRLAENAAVWRNTQLIAGTVAEQPEAETTDTEPEGAPAGAPTEAKPATEAG